MSFSTFKENLPLNFQSKLKKSSSDWFLNPVKNMREKIVQRHLPRPKIQHSLNLTRSKKSKRVKRVKRFKKGLLPKVRSQRMHVATLFKRLFP